MEKLHGTQVLLRLLSEDDVEPLTAILAQPEIARWWGVYDAARVRKELLESELPAYAVEVDGEVIGSIQYDEEPAPDYRHAGMDLFLSSDRHGRGYGSDAVRTLARHLIHDRGHHRLVIDPQVTNEAAIRCYESVGFRKVGLMRAYERGPDGRWHDCLMLEVLKDELT
ncbi:GNAT family N-acetyltransferase [Euzebya tangerina]|uniref:GNAT family N-acetyltransferase n=1 Tax=Euzebya tangerina TaxID=591198 RepID=UPI000E318487